MSQLRITQSTVGEKRYRVHLEFLADGQPRRTAAARFDFEMTEQDQEDLRWYLEDYLQYPQDPAPTVAARIERRMGEIGTRLFRSVFHRSVDARDLWAQLRPRLDDTSVEIVTSVEEAASIPWELIRDPKTDTPLALRARAFVRAQPQPAQRPELPQSDSGPIRILLVICRPSGAEDVPFRSVASQLIKGLTEQARATFQLDVLRPPTFEQLSRVLRQAKTAGKPYHTVHFDGHGMYAEVADTANAAEWLKKLIPLVLSGPRTGKHGFLLFENPQGKENVQLVDGPTLGKLLVEADVPVLVLNACRSAHAEAPTQPQTVATEGDAPAEPQGPTPNPAQQELPDVHAEVRAFGSLAQEVMDAGVGGIVAMRYNVYVVTAAQFVADLYATLVRGQTLGEAVTLGRKQLAANPQRSIAYDPRPLQDWCVPVVYEAAPISLFPKNQTGGPPTITLRVGESAAERGSLDERLPKPPDLGFFGRDETLLAIDRAFDTQSVVLLHAYAGSGKTATAAELARWYSLTGGVDGPVLFTSFELYTPLPRVLDRIGDVFGMALERDGIHWLALDDAKRRDAALQILKQVPVLWIWDNVEPVAGFPKGTTSAWTAEEQQALVDFLRDAQQTNAKFLLTSRREEREWLGDTLPRRIQVPPMPMLERVQLARALVEKHGRRLSDVDDWRALLRFTEGNPLTITVLVSQALRDGLTTKEQIEAFVSALRAGEAKFTDEASQGRTGSLGASLRYGFEHAFDEAERRRLALLHLCQGFIDVDVLRAMGDPEAPWCLPEVRGLTREAGIALLDRAAEVGLLTAHGKGYYAIHPALPWFFKDLFVRNYPGRELAAKRAFAEAMGELGNYYHHQYNEGNRGVIDVLAAEEANLLHARRLAREHGWWAAVTSAMQGLQALYNHRGRREEWRRLVEEIVPDFVDPRSDKCLPGRKQEAWSVVMEYQVRLAREDRDWAEAERLQVIGTDWSREQAQAALDLPPKKLTEKQRYAIRNLGVSLHELGQIRREQGRDDCVANYEESLKIDERLGDRGGAAISAFNLGHSYMHLPAIRDLEQAEHWYRVSLEGRDESDRLGRGNCLGQLGAVARERFVEARAAKQPKEELERHLNDAGRRYHEALELFPSDAIDQLAVTHGLLGSIYGDAGDLGRALPHYRNAIRYTEEAGDPYSATVMRFNVAVDLTSAGRVEDALDYAESALRGFESFGPAAADKAERARNLIDQIRTAKNKRG